MQQINSLQREHVGKFDVLRGVAIVMVFLYHAQLCIYPGFDKLKYNGAFWDVSNERADRIFLNLIPTADGGSGVWLFLIISGFLIHYSYLRKSPGAKLDFVQFFSRRFWRIYPPYLIVLLFFAFATGGVQYVTTQEGAFDLVAHLLLAQNLSDQTYFSINPSFWSLALEFQLYLLYPVFIYVRNKIGIEKSVVLAVAVTCVCTAFVPFFASRAFENSALRYWIIWIAGAYLAERYVLGEQVFRRHFLWGSVLLVLFTGLKFFAIYHLVYPFVATLFFLVLIDYYINSNKSMKGYEHILTKIGVVSYSLYLVHQPFLGEMLLKFDVLNISTRYYWPFKYADAIVVFAFYYLISYTFQQKVEVGSVKLGNAVYNYFALRRSSTPKPPLRSQRGIPHNA